MNFKMTNNQIKPPATTVEVSCLNQLLLRFKQILVMSNKTNRHSGSDADPTQLDQSTTKEEAKPEIGQRLDASKQSK